jgi:hypothetical protein
VVKRQVLFESEFNFTKKKKMAAAGSASGTPRDERTEVARLQELPASERRAVMIDALLIASEQRAAKISALHDAIFTMAEENKALRAENAALRNANFNLAEENSALRLQIP